MSERYPFLNPDAEMAREFNRQKEAEVAQVAKSGQQFIRLEPLFGARFGADFQYAIE